MYSFNFSIGNSGIPTITLLANGISFNRHCIAALCEPEYITIGIDRENKILTIKAANGTDDNSFCRYNFVTSEKKSKYLIISASKLRAEITQLTRIKPARKGIKFVANYDNDTNMLIVELEQKDF